MRVERYGLVHRADDPNPPAEVDFVLYEEGLRSYGPAFRAPAVFHRGDPHRTIAAVLASNEDMAVPLARQFPVFRHAVVERIIHSIARENALFAVATALPDVVPNLVELPWALGEWASDTAFLTANQFRMAFLIAAASGSRAGFADQKGQILSIAAGAFGWRAIARELAGKIPFGGGLIPKGAIAYAGTYVVGKALERWQHTQTRLAREERRKLYETALERGRTVVRDTHSRRIPVAGPAAAFGGEPQANHADSWGGPPGPRRDAPVPLFARRKPARGPAADQGVRPTTDVNLWPASRVVQL